TPNPDTTLLGLYFQQPARRDAHGAAARRREIRGALDRGVARRLGLRGCTKEEDGKRGMSKGYRSICLIALAAGGVAVAVAPLRGAAGANWSVMRNVHIRR